jgi:hypothetical protein
MNLRDKIKYALPMTFAILFVLTLLTFGILCILGVYPFKIKSTQNGVIFILVGLFFGFYPGILFGHFILYLINKCDTPESHIVQFSV